MDLVQPCDRVDCAAVTVTPTAPRAADAARNLDELRWEARLLALPEPFYARVAAEPLQSPYLVGFNPAAAELLGLHPAAASEADFVRAIAGARPIAGTDPVALRYSGHQFGVYVPQLGDGRALLLGEVVRDGPGPDGLRTEVQLKGSGRTPFSRGGDGRAVLRSTIREYLGCEAMHGLGVPTTRALAVVGSDERVMREGMETTAVLVRLASSHLRFGSFEMFARIGRPELVRALADFVLATQLPALAPGDYLGLLQEAVTRTAHMVAAWQAVGFTHGVMNSDNMSILGLTLDYGPFSFMEGFDMEHVPNHSDHEGRYAFGRQPGVALWNLGCLASALQSLLPPEVARPALASFAATFASAFEAHFQRKLGLAEWRGESDEILLRGLFRVLAAQQVDYPRFFRLLCDYPDAAALDALRGLMADPRGFDAWAEFYRERLVSEAARDADQRRAAMRAANPKYVLRGHLAERAIAQAQQHDFTEVDRLLHILAAPFDEQPEHAEYALPAPPGSEPVALSCSS
ncbi:MAG: YdiU family protein [Deltaproteobacteria bacterium]|nr:YdiU family protein [Deltaproteobacteria bacterium]